MILTIFLRVASMAKQSLHAITVKAEKDWLKIS